jgi:Tfp pilus assembly PilM family ATPase
MKLLTIQIEKNVLRLAQINSKGNRCFISKMRSFDLPENLYEGRYAADPHALSDYIISSIEKGRLPLGKAALLLGASSVIHKEYTHEPVRQSHLLALANLEAETILPEDEGEFIVENLWYGQEKNEQGLQTSSIFASSNAFVTDLAKALKQGGIKVVGVYSSLGVYSQLMKRLISGEVSGDRFEGKTVAALDISYPELRLAIYHKGQLIHQRMDEQLIDELYRTVASAHRIPMDAVGNFLLKNGLIEEKEGNKSDPSALEQTMQSVATTFSRLLRSINIILSAEGLSLDYLLVSGEGSSIPGLLDFVGDTSGISVGSAEEFYSEFSHVLELEGELADRTDLYASMLLLGAPGQKAVKSLNFLTQGLKRRRSKGRTYLICGLILLLTLIVMSLQPINYMIAVGDRDKNIALMESPEYVAVQQLLDEQRQVRNQLSEAEAEKSKLPFGGSGLSERLKILQSELFVSTTVNTLQYDHETGRFSGEVVTGDLNLFIDAKKIINEQESFRVSIPLTLYRGDNNWYCQFEIELLKTGEEEK